MLMNSLPRTLLVSVLLHCAAFMSLANYAAKEKERPVVVELSLSQLSGGSEGDASEIAAKKGSKAAPAAGKPSPHYKGATPRQIKPAAGNAAPTKAVEQAPQAVARPVPTAPALQAQAQQPGATTPPAGKQAVGSAARPGSTGGEPGKSDLGGASGPAGGASGRGSGSGSGNAGGYGDGRGNSPEQLHKKYLSENFAYILKIIQDHIVYPNKARREGLTGKGFVSFVVLENGQVAQIKLLRSTGYEILDLNLIKTIKAVAPFPKPPIKAELQMALSYSLEQ
jgi:periplasmic protein TonB